MIARLAGWPPSGVLTLRFHTDGGPHTFDGTIHHDLPRLLEDIAARTSRAPRKSGLLSEGLPQDGTPQEVPGARRRS